MQNASKSPENDVLAGIMSRILLETDDMDGELISPEFQGMVEELMRELYKEINTTPPSLSSPAVVVGNEKAGKGESCGASVSEFSSTVMVGVDSSGSVADGGEMLSPVANELEFWGENNGGGDNLKGWLGST